MAKHEYRILSRKTEGGLATVVEEFLDAGWQLVGGIFIERQGKEPPVFYQAILRTTLSTPAMQIHIEDARETVNLYSKN